MTSSLGKFTVRVIVAVSLASLAFLLWYVREALLVVFGGILLAVLIRSAMRLLTRHTRIGERWALALVILALIGIVALVWTLVGLRVSSQFSELQKTLQHSLHTVAAQMDSSPTGRGIAQALRSAGQSASSTHLLTLVRRSVRIAAGAVLMVFIGVYLAANPRLYRRGLVRLMPPRSRSRIEAALDAAAAALAAWLRGVLLAMLAIGATTGIGLWALGVPLALALALLAGLLEFIPYIGPVISAVPAIIVAFAVSPMRAVEVIVLYVLIHQLEGDVLVPLLQRWTVRLPPAAAVTSVVVAGVLFGPVGVVFATPLMVTCMTLVEKLYAESESMSQPPQ